MMHKINVVCLNNKYQLLLPFSKVKLSAAFHGAISLKQQKKIPKILKLMEFPCADALSYSHLAEGKVDVVIPTLLPEIDEAGATENSTVSNITDSIDSAAIDSISEEEIKKVEAKVEEFSSSTSSTANENTKEQQIPEDINKEHEIKNTPKIKKNN